MKFSWLLTVLMGSSVFAVANAASLSCNVTGVNVQVRSEGLTEQLGDIVLNCTGGPPGATISGNLSVYLPVAVTNRLLPGNLVDAVLTVDTGSGPVSSGATPALQETNAIEFGGVSFTLPANGSASMRISNLRAAVTQFGASSTSPIQALLSWSGSSQLAFDQATLIVATPHVGLLAGFASTVVGCHGSPVPLPITVSTLVSTATAVSTVRVTEGFTSAFGPGVRFLVTYSGYPAGARLFVPDAIAGSDAYLPTRSGLLGGAATGGAYTGGSGTLFLLRVVGADPDGAGGVLATVPGLDGSATVALDGASEVSLTNGAGFAVFQVMDQNPLTGEHAEIPTWLGLPPTGGAIASPREGVTFAPVSSVATATATDPIPRFAAVPPPADCSMLNDCASFPTLSVQPDPKPFEFTVAAGSKAFQKWVWVKNTGGGALGWTSTLQFTSGTNWAKLTEIPDQGVNVLITPTSLAPGVYEATLTIDAGWAGLANVPVKLTVIVPQPPASAPQVDSVVHAATLQPGPLVPGSLVSLLGSHLAGTAVSVTFGSLPATLLYAGERQITLQVPPALAGQISGSMTVSVDSLHNRQTVRFTDSAPGVFAILNQDSSVNGPGNTAAGGSTIQIFATGLPPASRGTISAKIHDVWVTSPAFAGPAPGLTGVQQINLVVPTGWPRMDTSVVVCGTCLATGARICSPQAPFSVK